MKRTLQRYLVPCLGLILVLSVFGCDSQDLGEPPEAEDEAPVEDVADDRVADRAASETCAVCHASGKLAGVDAAHADMGPSVTGTIGDVLVSETDGRVDMEVLFTLKKGGVPLPGISPGAVRFTAVRLEPGTNGEFSRWQSYINNVETHEADAPGTTPAGFDAVQATYESASAEGGVFTDYGDGAYAYRFSRDFGSVTEPVPVPYDPSLTHRIAMQIEGNVENPAYEFRPSDGAVAGIPMSKVVATASCNECHHRLALHGGDRVDVEYCVTCHNPGSVDANSGNSVDMKVMIHKIHMGAQLPSVEAGGQYTIWGYRDSPHDYSDVELPMDIRNCTKCHSGDDPATPDGNRWKTAPTRVACGSCHDDISFVSPPPAGMVMHTEGAREDESCAVCHTPERIGRAHAIPAMVAAKRFQYNILKVTGTSPGSIPSVTFSVTDPARENAPYDILADPEFTAPDGVSRLAVLVGWDNANYDNIGSGNVPAQPISIDALTQARPNGDGTFTVTATTPIPYYITGSGTAALEGHPAGDPDGDGVYDLRVPVENVYQAFPITDATAQPRRKVADIDRCNDCHVKLSLHGNNRTDAIQVCVICHNGNATDINRRPALAALAADGKEEGTIDFKYIIHAIHGAGMREDPLVVYGFGNREHQFDHVMYPGDVGNCEACHFPDTYLLPLAPNVWTTTVDTGEDLADIEDDKYTTPATAVCSSCHDNELTGIHMQQNGGAFDLGVAVPAGDGDGGDDDGGGEEVVQPPGHPTAPNCTTAFECHG